MSSSSYTPYGGAAAMWKFKDAEILYPGPAGTGKTRAVLEKANLVAMKYEKARILICRKTRASMTQSVLVTFEDKVLPGGSAVIGGARRSHRESYKYPNGSEVVVGGLDNADRIMSTEYDMVCLFEATEATADDWEKLQTRLRNGKVPYQQGIADCNPSYPRHWLKRRADDGKMTHILSKHEDNPTVTESYLDTLKKLTGHRRARLFEGKWAAAEGQVYPNWDSEVHVKPVDRENYKRAILSIDEGYTNPCSMHVYLCDSDDRVYVAEEWVKREQLERQVVKQVKRFRDKYNLEVVIVDPSAAKLIQALREEGISVDGANNDVFGGIQECQNRLDVPADGQPRLTVDPSCENFIDEIESYCWKENRQGDKEDKPVKVNDHSMDEFRYAMMYLFDNSGDFEAFTI